MEFRILGPLEVLHEDGPIPLGGSKRRALLALLLLHANEAVGAERLIDDLWAESPPSGAAKTLQVHVSRLRKAFADAGVGDVLVTRGQGYELVLDSHDLDAARFEGLFADGRAELADGHAGQALATLERALALWRGPALADLAYEPFAQAEIARLEDLRAATNEQLIEAKLALGRQSEVIAPLEALIEEHPYRERLRAQLMLALYRADRQADALQAYQNARTKLVDELGIEPGERLRELERAILAQDPALAMPVAAKHRATPAEAETPVEESLPSGVVTFLLTDVQGSSAMWEAGFDAMADALARHDRLIESTVETHGGRLLKTKGEGDSTLTAFPRASDAVTAAAELHRLLPEIEWPQVADPVVRVALYTGEAHERDGDYFGPALNRAARLRELARPGTALLSQTTAEIVRDRLPAGGALVELGRVELRGLARPEHVFELSMDDGGGEAGAEARRKTVTVLFACVTELEPPGEGLDPEARRRVGAKCLEDMTAVLERHGGAVQEYPGDTLMAVYGVPRLHEDDAARAIRAALELREAVTSFGVRIGIGTGDVIVETDERDRSTATGDAVSAAKRLEEAARAGEIVLDERTHRLVQRLVETEPGPETAVRLLALRAGGERERGLGSPLVGRSRQLDALSGAFSAAVTGRSCHLVTVLGDAGVGKSRLVSEFTAGLGDAATVACGRCLPYGEGITFWPLAEVVGELPDPVAAYLEDDPQSEVVTAVVAEAVGAGAPQGATSEKIFWAVRRLFEAAARRRPLVVILDDLHWAEPTFLDLVEHVAELARDAPIVLLCMARPELLDARPGWGGGKLNAASIHLEALEPGDTRELVANLLGAADLSGDAAHRLADGCEGNPLFAEELLSMLIEEGRLRRDGGTWTLGSEAGEMPLPPTIRALLAARIEQLPDDERALLARVAVAGSAFRRDAARELAPTALEPAVDRCLTALTRRDLLRPDRAGSYDDDAFRFRHILIRDAAYESLPKESRAELHGRFASWIERTVGDRLTETEEILGYHLEQAHRFLTELGVPGAETLPVAMRGAERLASAADRARARGDVTAAVRLLERAVSLASGADERRAELLPDLGAALIQAGRLPDAAVVLADALRAADAARDDAATARARVHEQFLRIHRGEAGGSHEISGVVDEATRVLGRTGDEHGLAAALRLRAWGHWIAGRAEAATAAWEDAAVHAANAGDEHERMDTLSWIASSMFFGPTPAQEAIRRCEAIRDEVAANLSAVADVLQPLAGLQAMRGSFEPARELLRSSQEAFDELGLTLHSAVSHHAAVVEMLAGDPAAAERILRRGYRTLEEMGDRALLSTTAAFLGQAVLAQGRAEEAETLAAESAELAAKDDVITHVVWRGVRAGVLAARGATADAEELAREAVALSERTDFSNQRADALTELGRVLARRGGAHDAREAFESALGLYESKGNRVAAEQLRADLAQPASL